MNWRKWLDDFIIASKGILLATKEKRFWYGFAPTFFFFGLLMNLLSGGSSKFDLMFALGFPYSFKIILDSFLGIFGVNQPFFDWLPIFCICLLQSILIGLIILLWKKKRDQNSANLGNAGIITGLIALGAGCPTCGTTLLTPLLGAIFSTGGLAIAGTISTIITIIAIIIAVLSLKRLGVETYVTIINEKYLAKRNQIPKNAKNSINPKEESEKSN